MTFIAIIEETSLAFYGARCSGLIWESVHRVGLYIMSRLCSNMSSIRLIVIIRYPETDEKWLERKGAQLTYFTPTFHGFLISSKTLCFALITRVSDEQVGLMISLKKFKTH